MRNTLVKAIGIVVLCLSSSLPLLSEDPPVFIWVEGEDAQEKSVRPHPWWYDQVKTEEFSGEGFISHWSGDEPGLVGYSIRVPESGTYQMWLRANPQQATMKVSINGAAAVDVPFGSAIESMNVAADGKADLRFLAWVKVADVQLNLGDNLIRFQIDSKNNNHGMIDAFTFVKGDFRPVGTARPPEVHDRMQRRLAAEGAWTPWNPAKDPHTESAIDLRVLNEGEAGENGFIEARDGAFVRPGDGEKVRFWAVNGPHKNLRGEALQHALRDMAKRGVNMVRIHGAVFDKKTGELRPDDVARIQEVVARAKSVGIYTHLSIYFPLWFDPEAGLEFLEGYDGKTHPFAALFFNERFEEHYQGWWRGILTARNSFGPTLVDEPALLGVELVNEDSLFFWTFTARNIPPEQLSIFEEMFGDWADDKYGSLEKAYDAWNGMKVAGDDLREGRLGFRPLHSMFTAKTQRDQDTAQFLTEVQRAFYERQIDFLEELDFKGMITASNWHTANDRIFKPLEIYSYLPGDFIDRHGYFGVESEGEHTAWSIRPGHVYSDRSALRFDPKKPGSGKDFSHPVADPEYNGLPSMISETTWNRPNRYRTEAPLFYAVYGALQGSDSIVHFAHDGAEWAVKPQFWMQPWTLMSPSQMGQFPAAALIYRLGLVDTGEVMAEVGLELESLYELKGTPLVQEGNLDELRLADVSSSDTEDLSGQTIDPRIHFVGRTKVTISEDADETEVESLEPYIDDREQIIRSQTGQIELDYGDGVLKVTAPKAQALSGSLNLAGDTDLGVLQVDSSLEVGHIILVSLDGRDLASSSRMLLQVMSEEKNSGWKTRSQGSDSYRVLDIGRDPWIFRDLEGSVRLNRSDANGLRVTVLDLNGYPMETIGNADEIDLRPGVAYYLIEL